METVALKMPVQDNKKKLSLFLFAAILVIGILVVFLLITIGNLNTPKITGKKAAIIPVSSGGSCPAGGARCSWTYGGKDEVTFKYAIKDESTNLIEATGETTATSVSFTPKPDHKYTCTVTVSNECGDSTPKSASNTCTTVLLSPTPTPLISPTPTPTGKPGVTPTVTPTGKPGVTPSITPTPNPSASPTPTATNTPTPNPSASPTPTPTAGPSATPTPTVKSPTPTEIIIVITATPAPGVTTIVQQPTTKPSTPPVAGSILPSILLIGASIGIIILGLVL